MRYRDPKIDPIFRRIFGEHEHLCCSLLNGMLPLEPSQQVVNINYQPNEILPDLPLLKNSIVDVNCTDNFGRNFIVEMQMHWTEAFKSRVLFNSAKVYVKQLNQGDDYKLLKPVYALNFVNDIFDKDSSAFYHDYKIVNVADSEKRIDGLEFVFVELPKFKPSNLAEKKLYDLWLTFLTGIKDNSEQVPSELLEEATTREAVKYLEVSSYTENELRAFDRYWDTISTERTLYNGKKDDGVKEGWDKGYERGLIEVVINGHGSGFSVEQIQVLTGLSKERISEIINSKVQI
ncbi:MAG: Rpn family recombination-promoting nuclease/putative transposase [Planctomycetaceae bacterium]|jgi:predicted transposase/invertase (TIGR01784 family)|nr:Rpn family recombination-promoting nuclease/putative transposase [Planctomycetaceae bacterium]